MIPTAYNPSMIIMSRYSITADMSACQKLLSMKFMSLAVHKSKQPKGGAGGGVVGMGGYGDFNPEWASLELTDTPINLANQIKVGHSLDQWRNGQSPGPERAHQNNAQSWRSSRTGPWFSIKITSYRYRKSHCGDKTVIRSSYLYNGISFTGKTVSLYWIRAQITSGLSRQFWEN